MTTRKKSLEAIEAAMAAHPKGKPLNERGELVPDSTPLAPPIGFKPQPSMFDIVRDQIRAASLLAESRGFESFEDADDFDVPDEFDPESRHEVEEEGEVPVSVLRARAREQARLDAEHQAAAAARGVRGAEPPAEADQAERPGRRSPAGPEGPPSAAPNK